jgi:arabinose-5-phosphate isomerase
MREDLLEAQRVLGVEIEGLQQLQSSLNSVFVDAVELLHKTKGRVIITGMGKSGHVARKIAATMASTGTPAYFVHPGEASHGDLGMITPEDCVLALSYSGETRELSDLISYTRRYHIGLIGITQGQNSTLGQRADICLAMPNVAEACSNQLAPTTSTTMMIALGDALALCLLKRKAFSKEDFKNFHPGGKLGSMLRTVQDIMHRGDKVPLVELHAPMQDVIMVMTAKSLGCAGVLDSAGRLVGIITDGDLRRHLSPDLLVKAAQDVMTKSPKVIGPNILIAEAVQIMNAKNITSLFVVEGDQKPCGIVHMHQCLHWE